MMFSFLVCFEFVWFLVPDLKTRLHARLFDTMKRLLSPAFQMS